MTRRPRQPEQASANSQTPFDAHIHAHGTCAICRERDTQLHHGAAHCAGNFRSQHPTCTHDHRQPRFAPDLAAIRLITGDAHAH